MGPETEQARTEEATTKIGPGCLSKTASLIYLALPSGDQLSESREGLKSRLPPTLLNTSLNAEPVPRKEESEKVKDGTAW